LPKDVGKAVIFSLLLSRRIFCKHFFDGCYHLCFANPMAIFYREEEGVV